MQAHLSWCCRVMQTCWLPGPCGSWLQPAWQLPPAAASQYPCLLQRPSRCRQTPAGGTAGAASQPASECVGEGEHLAASPVYAPSTCGWQHTSSPAKQLTMLCTRKFMPVPGVSHPPFSPLKPSVVCTHAGRQHSGGRPHRQQNSGWEAAAACKLQPQAPPHNRHFQWACSLEPPPPIGAPHTCSSCTAPSTFNPLHRAPHTSLSAGHCGSQSVPDRGSG